jgi:hypothetical protein
MTRQEDDRDLAAAFSALRREEEDQCPPFAVRRATPRLPRRRFAMTAAVTAGLVLAFLATWLGLRTPREPVPSLAEWRSPTDFLLDTPGREVLAAPSGLHRSVLDVPSPDKGRYPS